MGQTRPFGDSGESGFSCGFHLRSDCSVRNPLPVVRGARRPVTAGDEVCILRRRDRPTRGRAVAQLADVTVSSWLEAVTPLVSRFVADFERRFGYSPGDNRVERAAPGSPVAGYVPDELQTLYAHLHEI